MSKKLTPLGPRVIVKPQVAEETTSFGLVLSDSGKEKPMEGVIVSVSSTIKDCPVKTGDKVLFKKYSPTEFKIDSEELYVLDLEDILAKID
ncbi:co-chaperone GroES [Candidatus Peregrinibacteria bacterium]|jgi:chaperonin GroES|nr:co-chaperone GroES [Candidatus Peregrinibacteria bacterium]